jgi:exodeoxyribonuclease V beta subunit
MTDLVAQEFSITGTQLENGMTIEASAGSGKTFSVAGIVAFQIATQPNLRISEILVTTFTRNAAAELRDRIRRQLVSLERALRENNISNDDEIAVILAKLDRIGCADRLDRAIREFDSATIATIHSVCSRVMAMAGLPVVGEGRTSSDISQTIRFVVNAIMISHAASKGSLLFEDPKVFAGRLEKAVTEALSSPRSQLLVSGTTNEKEDENSLDDGLVIRRMVRECLTRINKITQSDPTFDDLLVRTANLLAQGGDEAVRHAFTTRFTIAIIDEAQDTDQLQWEIFRGVFAADETTRMLLAVGDPKQAIYRFRGADVEAYLAQRISSKVRTLTRNWRSDARLIRALNAVFAGKEFGEGIDYPEVSARDGAPETSIGEFPSLAILEIGVQTNQNAIVKPAAWRVRELLSHVYIDDATAENGRRLPSPREMCVLVNSKVIGRKIEKELRSMGIPAVSSGTESVMSSVMASDMRRLFDAMAHPGDRSRLRLAAATVFVGEQLVTLGALTDDALDEIALRIFEWASVVRRRGINAWAFDIRRVSTIVERLVAGREGERQETDFTHIVELLHAETDGKGCAPGALLDVMDRLDDLEDMNDTVSRRVESDRDAVQIMTVHASKGLEFPVVVVADLWKMSDPDAKRIPIFHRPDPDDNNQRHRAIDVGWVYSNPDSSGKVLRKNEEHAEKKRLFYVAVTRAKHHVSLIHATAKDDSDVRVTSTLLEDIAAEKDASCIKLIPYTKQPHTAPYIPRDQAKKLLDPAKLSHSLRQTYQRLSFSGLTKYHRGVVASPVQAIDPAQGGFDDDDDIITIRLGYTESTIDMGVPVMPMGRLMGGTYFGKVMHAVYEHIDFSATDLEADIASVVDNVVVGALAQHRDELIQGVLLSLRTPLGGIMGDTALSDISSHNRLAEMNFEMGLAEIDAQVTVSDMGATVEKCLRDAGRQDDILMPYMAGLKESFTSPLAGLMNGSIDALLRLSSSGHERYFITDYKTNRLDHDGVATMIDGYSREALLEEMEHHDYPLQALIYGVAVYRHLRWTSPDIDADAAIAGMAYFFVRAMVGTDTPSVDGHRHGVFTWEAPPGLWSQLSDVMSRRAQ